MRMFELGPGRKFRASTGPSGYLRLELRTPDAWTSAMPADVFQVAQNALALAAAGEPPKGFKFTEDDRYVDSGKFANPFEIRARYGR